jgi:hypothetical protein
MKNIDWDKLLKSLERLYYVDVLWLICAIIALIVCVKYFQRNMLSGIFIIYITCCILLTLADSLVLLSYSGIQKVRVFETNNIVFSAIEYGCFSYFFINKFKKNILSFLVYSSQAIILVLLIRFISIANAPTVTKEIIRTTSYSFNTIEFLFLLILCLVYFYNLFVSEYQKEVSLIKSPSFWIISGLFFYTCVSYPFLITGYFDINSSIKFIFALAVFHYVAISILLLCIAKAFSCKKLLTT